MDVLAYQQTPGQPPGRPEFEPELRRGREPMFNAPVAALALVGLIVGCYALQTAFPSDLVIWNLAFFPAALGEGRWWTLVTALFLHGGWPHALMNAAFALAFATPVARFLGGGALGTVVFFAFYLACGVLSNLGYAGLHMGGLNPLVGASGAVSGLMGGASRLVAGQGRLGKIWSGPVIGMGAAWVLVNLLIGLLGSSFAPGSGGAQVAWEAHLLGFVAGVLLLGAAGRIARRL